MSFSTCTEFKEGAGDRARAIKAMIFDSDGVLFPNIVLEGWGGFVEALNKRLPRFDSANVEIPVPKPKERCYYDGQGISLLRSIGLRILIVTNEAGPEAAAVTDFVNKLLCVPSSWRPNNRFKDDGKNDSEQRWPYIVLRTGMGGPRKLEAAHEFAKSVGIEVSDCGFMCDDLVDWDLAQHVGFLAAPVTAESVIKERADIISRRPAGSGAVRDIVNFILGCRNIDPTKIRIQ